MITVTLNEDKFAYDIHSLVKAFYPEQDVKVFAEGEKDLASDPGLPAFFVRFETEAIVTGFHRQPAALAPEGENAAQNVPGSTDAARENANTAPEGTDAARENANTAPGSTDAARENANTAPEGTDAARENANMALEGTDAARENAGTPRQWRAALTRPGDRVQVKNELKQLLYRMLSEVTKKELPWGTLTGIRPTKIAMQLLEQGKTEAEIFSYMQDTYLASQEKTALSIDIAKYEREILSGIHYEKGYSLYIGIPFCPTTCLYCSFTSFPICVWKKRVSEYLDALEKEIDFVRKACGDKILDSVYIGGGTPTTLEAEELERLLSKVRASFDWTHVQEFTVEAGRADSITRDKLRVLKKYGVTRISVNPQTMNQKTLKLIGRQHTVEQVVDAFYMARQEGFDNINMDLILGLPGESEADVAYTIERIKELAPDSLTVHSLAIKRASRLSQWIIENGISTLHNTDETMKIAAAGAHALGMKPYYLYRQKNMSGNFENVGYAVPQKAGIYNILIMEEKESILALGAGTISKAVFPDGRIERCDNVKDVALYMEKIDEMIGRKRKLLGLEK